MSSVLFKIRRKWILAVCLTHLWIWVAVHPVSAQVHAGDTITGKTHAIEEVEIKARRTPAKLTTAAPVQVLTKEEIKSLGLQNVADVARRFAGTNVRDYGGIGGLKTVSVRNLGAAHTAVSYDGVVVSNCLAGQIDIGRFSLDNVSRVSLAIGQEENLLQPARLYASAGALNIETEKPRFTEGSSTSAQLQVRGGSFGYIAPSARWWQKVGSRTSLSFDAGYQHADGEYPFTLINGKQVTEEKRRNSDIDSYQGEVNLFHAFRDGSELQLKGYYFDSERGLPGSVILYNNETAERLWDRNGFAQALYKKTFSPRWVLQAQGKYNYAWNKYEDYGVKYEHGVQTDINKQHEYYLSATALYQPAEKWRIALSQDGILNKLYTNGVNSPSPTRYTSLTALNVCYQWETLKVSGILLATYITENVKHGNVPEDRKRLSPTASLSWQPWEGKDFYLRAMYKNTFRVPTFSDLYYLRVGNTNLLPEKATEYTLGVTGAVRPSRLLDVLTFTLDGYYNRVSDKIIAFPSTYVWKMQNYGKVNIAGIDLTMSTSASLAKEVTLRLSGNYSWQRAVDVTNPDAKNYKHQLPYTPEHNGGASLTLEMPWVNVGYTVTAVSKRYYLAQNLPENEIEGYCEHTVTLWREFSWGKHTFRLQLEGLNLANTQYEVIKYYPMPRRSWRLMGVYRF